MYNGIVVNLYFKIYWWILSREHQNFNVMFERQALNMSISDLVLIVTRYLAHANLHGIKRKYTFAILKKSVNYIITHIQTLACRLERGMIVTQIIVQKSCASRRLAFIIIIVCNLLPLLFI